MTTPCWLIDIKYNIPLLKLITDVFGLQNVQTTAPWTAMIDLNIMWALAIAINPQSLMGYGTGLWVLLVQP